MTTDSRERIKKLEQRRQSLLDRLDDLDAEITNTKLDLAFVEKMIKQVRSADLEKLERWNAMLGVT